MASAAFPALAINTQGESPINLLGKVEQIKSAQQSQEMGQIQLEQARLHQQSQQIIAKAWADNAGDPDKTLQQVVQSGRALPDDVISLQSHFVDLKTKAAILSDDQLKVQTAQNGVLYNELRAFQSLPIEQRTPDKLQGVMARLASQNIPIDRFVPYFQQIAKDPSDATLRPIEFGLAGQEKVLQDENQFRKQQTEYFPSAAENKASYEAQFNKVVADTNEAAAKASLDIKQAALAGTVTDKDKYDRQTQLLKSVYDRQTAFANTLYQSGLKQLDSMFTDPQHGYIQFLAQAQNTKNTINAARSGNEVAASLEPLMTALGVTSFAGVHRINQNEVNAAGPGVGSLYRQLNSTLSKMGSGSVPKDTLNEVDALIDGMIDSKHASLIGGANMIAANAGIKPSQVMVMGRGGELATLDQAGKNNPRAGSVTPSTGGGHIIQFEGKRYQYKGTGDTSDIKNYTALP